MTNYKFVTKEFGLTYNGIHLLRKGYNYSTIDYHQVQRVEIARGHELKNWFAVFAIGAVLLLAGIYMVIPIIELFSNGGISSGQVRIALIGLIPVVGFYFVYSSLQMGTILTVEYANTKSCRFSLTEFVKKGDISDFKFYLEQKIRKPLIVRE